MRVVFVENHDSFSWNVIELLPVPRHEVVVVHTEGALDALAVADAVVIGPGPMDPLRAGLLEVVRTAAERRLPTLGVCLGHQALGLAFGARLVASTPAHGKLGRVTFGTPRLFPLFDGALEVMRYHSLSLVDVAAPLRVVARLEDGTVMAIEHTSLPMAGVQFHPDSWATPRGRELVRGFFERAAGLGRPPHPRAPAPSAPPRLAGSASETGDAAVSGAGSAAGAPTPQPVAPPEAESRAAPTPPTEGPGRRRHRREVEPERVPLSSLRGLDDFALLSPGFTGTDAWTLLTHVGAGGDELVVCEAEARTPRWLGGRRRAIRLELDVAPAEVEPRLDEDGFLEAVASVRQAVARGDVYQVNVTRRAWLGELDGAALLATVCRRSVPRFGAWLKVRGLGELVSASPELLMELEGRVVRVEPMKGTAQAGQRAWLEASVKDAAELGMITDLLRDDLQPLCVPGSVRVLDPRRFVVLPYVVQTVADVEGLLAEGVTANDVLARVHPGGSVTGAPRQAALDVIARLESTPRRFYCGALGLRTQERLRTALLIRTACREPHGWWWGVGGGVTWDSEPHLELAELHLKLGALRT